MIKKCALVVTVLLLGFLWSEANALNLVSNGDFEGGFYASGDDSVPNSWTKVETFSGGGGETSIIKGALDNGPSSSGSWSLNWVRSNGGASGDWTGCEQVLNANVTNSRILNLTIDVKAFSHNLGGSGTTPEDWEYPVTVVVYYTDTGGTSRYWQWGWYLWIDESTGPPPDHEQVSGNGVVTAQNIPPDLWVLNSFNLLTELINPATINRIRVSGSGWDFAGRADNVQIRCERGWYWKPSYADYAPSGMPDFDQKQDNWKKQVDTLQEWTFCGPVAVANCWWWFDSKFNQPAGVPGDGWDQFPLVRDYLDNNPPLVGFDDHDPWNVDHVNTPWNPPNIPAPPATPQPFVTGAQPVNQVPSWGELVERLAWFFDTDGIRTTYCTHTGTNVMTMQEGIYHWFLSETFPDGRTLADVLYERTIEMPTFAQVESLVEESEDVILLLGFWYFGTGEQEFIRGDINADGVVNAADVSRCYAGPPYMCDDAADVNDDGVLNSLDCTYLNNYLMGVGPPPPPPFPDCGVDPTADALGCATFPPCPPGSGQWYRVGGHYVTVAGVCSDSLKIAFSDPCVDWAEQGNPGVIGNGTIIPHVPIPHADPTIHNDAGNVSHDIYAIMEGSPSPGGSWWIPGYPASVYPEDWMSNFGSQNVPDQFLQQTRSWDGMNPVHTEVEYAVVVSPKNRPPEIIQPDTLYDYKVCDTVYYTFHGIDPDGDSILDQASLSITPSCGTYSVSRISGQGSSSGSWLVSWITIGCNGNTTYRIIVDLTDAMQNTSYCTTYCTLADNHPPRIDQPDTLSALVGDEVSYDITGNDPDSDVISDQASIQVIPSCGTYSITRTSGQGTPSGVWHVSWQTAGCSAGSYLVIHDLTDGCGTSYCTTYVNLHEEEGWYWKPAYPDYAPSGMPDFDEKQDNWIKLETSQFTFCGPAAVANCFWWFDSKYQVPPLVPGDGMDMFPLVRDYLDNNPPFMGIWDDHDPWNVDHVATPWSPPAIAPPPATLLPFVPGPQPQPSGLPPWGELVERLAWYFDTDGSRTGYCQHTGTRITDMYQGIQAWLASELLTDTFCVVMQAKPTFIHVDSLVEKSEDVILLLGFWFEDPPGSGEWYRCGGHYVTMAGVNSQTSQIAISDPYLDAAEMGLPGRVGNGMIIPHLPGHPAPTHNDAGNVSHDIYTAISPSPSPGGVWALADYPGDCYDFNYQNFPDEFLSQYRTWNGVSPVFTEVEYALHISPWDYRGDVNVPNGDGMVDISDVVFLINYLFKHGSVPVPFIEGDANCDGVVDVGDVVTVINYLFRNGPVPKCCDP